MPLCLLPRTSVPPPAVVQASSASPAPRPCPPPTAAMLLLDLDPAPAVGRSILVLTAQHRVPDRCTQDAREKQVAGDGEKRQNRSRDATDGIESDSHITFYYILI